MHPVDVEVDPGYMRFVTSFKMTMRLSAEDLRGVHVPQGAQARSPRAGREANAAPLG
jgi:hypothetical protein